MIMRNKERVSRIRVKAMNISIKKWDINYFEIKIISFISHILDETLPLVIHNPQAKKGTSVSKKFALFS